MGGGGIKDMLSQYCTIKKKISGNHAPEPPSQAPQNTNWPPLANPAYAHELLLRNLFENPPWQTVDCV